MTAGQLLRETRRRHGVDQRALARRAGTSQAQISRIERAKISPSVDTLAHLLAAMGERLGIDSMAGPLGNRSTAELRADYQRLTAGERVVEAGKLSEALTTIAAGNPIR